MGDIWEGENEADGDGDDDFIADLELELEDGIESVDFALEFEKELESNVSSEVPLSLQYSTAVLILTMKKTKKVVSRRSLQSMFVVNVWKVIHLEIYSHCVGISNSFSLIGMELRELIVILNDSQGLIDSQSFELSFCCPG